VQAFLVDELRHRHAEERFARVGDAVTERGAVRPAALADVVFVVDVERSAEAIGDRYEINARERDVAVGADAG
jgi:hypothetical protein